MTPSTQSTAAQFPVMHSSFITLDLPLEDSPSQMEEAIHIALEQWGDPLRWAVMAVDVANQIVRIEAIVTHRLNHDAGSSH